MYRKVSIKNIKDLVLKSSGLEVNDVIEQRKVFGTNTIVEDTGHPWKALVSDTLKDPMVWFLIGIATLFFIIGDRKEAFILFVATLPLILMDAFLHWRTQASTSGLKSQLSSKVLVLRAGVKQKINSLDLVPGDLVILSEENNFLPADGYWEKTDSLQLDESVLTGESLPIVKSSTILEFKYDQEELSIESNCLGYAGTRVLSGNGLLRILSTGKNTSYGEIIQSVVTINHEQTPLQRAIFELTRYLIMAAILFCFLLAGIRYYQGHGWLDALLSAGVLAVAAIPEEFPVVFSFFLGVGVYRLAKHRALVRKAVSVENIGRVTQICTDKTGTITRGELQLAHVDLFPGIGEEHIISLALVASNLKGSDPVDVAIIEASRNKNIIIPERIHTIPFTEDRKRETAFFIKDDKNFCVVKGSPEVVMGLSNLAEGEFNEWNQRVLKWAKGGHKVLAVASSVIEGTDGKSFEGPTRGFSFLGLLVFEDPARPEVKNAILYCQRNAIKVLMITGDHPQTAEAIARDIGLGVDSPKVVSAEEEAFRFEGNWPEKNANFFKNVHVLARCNPMQKLRIVEALKKSGEIVLVTGDGVNDVPALKAANIGVAMGMRGTRSAKEVSSIILSDDNFSTIVDAIREGKQLFENLRISFKYLLLFHIPFVLSAAIIPLMGYPLLFLPIHVVWLELLIHPSALFAFQQSANASQAVNLGRTSSFFSKKESLTILLIGLLFTVVLIFSYLTGVSENQDIGHGRAKALVLLALWSGGLISVLTKGRTRLAKIIVLSTLISTIVLIQNGWLAKVLHLSPLHLMDWAKLILTVGISLVLLVFLNRLNKNPVNRATI